jgi:hypothetical protein
MRGCRKAFAKHYCPVRGNALMRVRLPWLESLLRETLLFLPFVFIAVVVGGVFASFGLLAGSAALVAGFVVAAIVLYPLVEQFSIFRCSACAKDIKFSETISRE